MLLWIRSQFRCTALGLQSGTWPTRGFRFASQKLMSLNLQPIFASTASAIHLSTIILAIIPIYLNVFTWFSCNRRRYIHTEAIQVKPGVYNGTYVTYNSTENKTFSLADRCPSSQLLFVKCPIQCGRQASIMAAGRRHFEPLKMGRARSMPGNARSLVTTELEPRSRATSLPSG